MAIYLYMACDVALIAVLVKSIATKAVETFTSTCVCIYKNPFDLCSYITNLYSTIF